MTRGSARRCPAGVPPFGSPHRGCCRRPDARRCEQATRMSDGTGGRGMESVPMGEPTYLRRGERACDQALSHQSGGGDLNSRPLRPERASARTTRAHVVQWVPRGALWHRYHVSDVGTMWAGGAARATRGCATKPSPHASPYGNSAEPLRTPSPTGTYTGDSDLRHVGDILGGWSSVPVASEPCTSTTGVRAPHASTRSSLTRGPPP
jgi:hypothetical protein